MSPYRTMMTLRFALAASAALLPSWLAFAAETPDQATTTAEAYPPVRATLPPASAVPPLSDTPTAPAGETIAPLPPVEPPVIGRVPAVPAEPTMEKLDSPAVTEVHRSLGTHARRLRTERDRQPAGGAARGVVSESPRVRPAHDRAQPPLSVLHRRRAGKAQHADRDRAAADDRERLQPAGLFARARRPASGSSSPRPGANTGCSRTSGTTAGATCSPPPAPRSTTCSSCTTCSATGSSRWPPTTGARTACSARSRRIARITSRPTTSA